MVVLLYNGGSALQWWFCSTEVDRHTLRKEGKSPCMPIHNRIHVQTMYLTLVWVLVKSVSFCLRKGERETERDIEKERVGERHGERQREREKERRGVGLSKNRDKGRNGVGV